MNVCMHWTLSLTFSNNSEGLTFANGILYESAGLWQHSSIHAIVSNSSTNATSNKRIFQMNPAYFAEGLTVAANGSLIQLTYQSKTGFIYPNMEEQLLASSSSTELQSIPFHYETTTGEGWGMTYDAVRNELWVSDGSNQLHVWELHNNTVSLKRRLTVQSRHNGKPALQINELEWWRGRILANIWYEDVIVVIHPETGVIEKEYNMEQLYEHRFITAGAGVLNGISVSDDENVLYVTGKNWNRMYRIRLF